MGKIKQKRVRIMAKGVKGFQRGNQCGTATRFTAKNQPANRGRKKRIYSKVLKDPQNKLSAEEFREVLHTLLEMSVQELELILSGDSVPVWIITVINALFSDAKRGRIYVLTFLLDQVFGKPTETLEVQQEINLVNAYNFSNLTTDELKEFCRLFEKIIPGEAPAVVNPEKDGNKK